MGQTLIGPVSVTPDRVEIPGRVLSDGKPQSGFVDHLRLEVPLGHKAPAETPVKLLSEDLRVEEGGAGQDPDRGHLTVEPRETTLKPGVPVDVTVTATGITVPGVYSTEILVVAGATRATVPVSIRVTAVPEAKIVPSPISWRLAACGYRADCALTEWVLPARASREVLAATVEWGSRTASVPVERLEVRLRGEHTGVLLDEADLVLVSPKAGTAEDRPSNDGGLEELQLKVDRGTLRPDRYSGAVYLGFAGEDTRRAVPVDLAVRQGPLVPLVVLASSVVAGWFLSWLFVRGRQTVKAAAALLAAQRAMVELHNDDANVLRPHWQEADKLVDAGKFDEAIAAAERIGPRATALQVAREYETQLEKYPPADQASVRDKLAAVRAKVRAEAPTEELAKAVQALREIAFPQQLWEYGEVAAASMDPLSTGRRTFLGIRLPGLPGERLRRSVSRRGALIAAQVGLRVLPWFAFVVLLGLGVKEAYLDNDVFGAQPFRDYFGLVLWGLGAWATKRATANLVGSG